MNYELCLSAAALGGGGNYEQTSTNYELTLTFPLRLFTLLEYWRALVAKPGKTELEYRVIAVNKSGEGQASNTEMVVL